MRTRDGVTVGDAAGGGRNVIGHDVLGSDAFECLHHAATAYPPLGKHVQPVLSADEPWEFHWVQGGRNAVLFDPRDGLFKMWYVAADPDHPERAGWYAKTFLRCYATSRDGVHWTRPSLGLFEHRGSKRNNIIDESAGDGFLSSVVLDLDADDPAARFKSMGFCDGPEGPGVYAGRSPDGIRWERVCCVASTTRATDGAALIGRHPLTLEWMAVVRPRTLPKRRFLGISTSADFTAWSAPRVVLAADHDDPPGDELDSLSTTWTGSQFVGVIGVFHTRPDDQTYDGQLAWSHDGSHWHRPARRPILPLSSPGQWDDSQVRPTSIVRRGNELFIYYSGANRGQGLVDVEVPAIGSRAGGKTVSGSIGLVRTPVDRFAAIESIGREPGLAVTRFISADGPALRLNADAAGGTVRVQVRDVMEKPIPGLTFDDCVPVSGDSTGLEVTWRNDSLGDHVGDTSQAGRCGPVIKLEFELKNSRLYAFRFGKTGDGRNVTPGPTRRYPRQCRPTARGG